MSSQHQTASLLILLSCLSSHPAAFSCVHSFSWACCCHLSWLIFHAGGCITCHTVPQLPAVCTVSWCRCYFSLCGDQYVTEQLCYGSSCGWIINVTLHTCTCEGEWSRTHVNVCTHAHTVKGHGNRALSRGWLLQCGEYELTVRSLGMIIRHLTPPGNQSLPFWFVFGYYIWFAHRIWSTQTHLSQSVQPLLLQSAHLCLCWWLLSVKHCIFCSYIPCQMFETSPLAP